jgi:ABC-2 type transport system ATP-binding protein
VVIEVHNLSKVFRVGLRGRSLHAVRDVSFEVQAGEVFGFIGPNGAGKSTTIHLLLGLVRPTGGRGTVLGQALGSTSSRRQLGYLPELPNFYSYLRARELLQMSGQLAGLGRGQLAREIPERLEQVGLAGRGDEMLGTFSKGMLQRVGLAQALLGDPRLLILDEPMSGLDPIGRHTVRRVILSLRGRGTTVFFSSHVMPDVEALCDRVALVAAGRTVRVGTVDELVRGSSGGSEVHLRLRDAAMPPAVPEGLQASRVGDVLRIHAPDEASLQRVIAWAARAGTLVAIAPERASLEEVVVRELERLSAAGGAP